MAVRRAARINGFIKERSSGVVSRGIPKKISSPKLRGGEKSGFTGGRYRLDAVSFNQGG